ncbi:hypothetical protein, partial [Nocardia abscessus]|uniref:hypothetical protein n=1 Tax=Nocardia abscessus TaxID=120957 RepID=UPI002453A0D0
MEEHSNAPSRPDLIAGVDPRHPLDLLLVNAPLRDYALRPRVNNFTLPVLGMAYIATYAASHGYNVGVLDGAAPGRGIDDTLAHGKAAPPPGAGFNLLAPT